VGSNANPTSSRQDGNGGTGAAQDAAAFFTILAVLIYPVGLLIFAVQFWTAYASPLTISLYAAALAPTSIVAFKVVHSLFWYFGAFFCALIVRSLKTGASFAGVEDWRGKGGLLIFVILTPLTTPTPVISSALGPTHIYTWRGLVLYGLFVIFVLLAGYRSVDLLPEVDGMSWRSRLLRQVPIYLLTILAATCVAGAQDPALPSVHLGKDQREVSLLSHTQGYWYVFDESGNLSAVPGDEAGTVKVR
jgi:hypothetical protein